MRAKPGESVTKALRVTNPGWKDPRLLIGVTLLVVSVLLGSAFVRQVSRTSTVYVAKAPVALGQELSPEQFVEKEVKLGDALPKYVQDLKEIKQGSVATYSIQSGELLAKSALGQSDATGVRPLPLTVESTVSNTLSPGNRVEVWVTGKKHSAPGSDQPLSARKVLSGVAVKSIQENRGLAGSAVTVEIMVPAEAVGAVLGEINTAERVDVVAIPGVGEVDHG